MYGTPSKVSDQPPQLQTDADTAAADKDNSDILGSVLYGPALPTHIVELTNR
jgi:hypothetical protein